MPARARRNLSTFTVSFLILLGLVSTSIAERAPERRHLPTPAGPVHHETKFSKVPGGKLQIRAVEYDGSTNGTLKVQVKNPSKTAQTFSATGLYFVPEGDPSSAPQRLGAVGPMHLETDNDPKELTQLEVAAGATVEVALDVFCIDSHRASPSPTNVFNVASARLPKELAQTIEQRADLAVSEARKHGDAAPRPAAKATIQSEVWRSRDAKWIRLDGEGSQEAAK